MKKVFNCLLAVLMLSLVFGLNSCKKDQTQSNKLCDVSFNVNRITNLDLKDNIPVPQCADGQYTFTADYAIAYITGGQYGNTAHPYTIPIFYVGGVPWTSSIQLSAGQYCLQDFVVYGHLNNGQVPPTEMILFAGVHLNAQYAVYVTTPLPICFTVGQETKQEIKVDVLCYQQQNFTYYGFVYFKIRMGEVHQICFFGDFCIKHEADYVGSGYDLQQNWTGGNNYGDFIALFKISVYLQNEAGGWDLQGEFWNDITSATPGHVCANYVDYIGTTENYKVILSIWVKQGATFTYVPFQTWYFTDVDTYKQVNGAWVGIPKNSQGYTDFVLGTCYDPTTPPVLVLPPYQNLPATCTIEGVNCYCINPSSLGAYMDIAVSGIGGASSGYDLIDGTYATNCCETDWYINCGSSYSTHIYSTLYQTMLPSYLQDPVNHKWNKINWLLNHLDWFPGYHWYDIQGVIWEYDDWNGSAEPSTGSCAGGSVPAYNSDPLMQLMYNTSNQAVNANYVPLPGGYALLLFQADGSGPGSAHVQTMAIKLDP